MPLPNRPHAEEPPKAASRSIEAAPSFETPAPRAPQDRGGGGLKRWARAITRDVHALYLAARDPRVPWYAKLLAGAVAAYALSPIDLIPDFIPLLGQLDDLIIVPLGILAVVALIPPAVMAEHRAAAAAAQDKPRSMAGAIAIIALWTALTLLFCWLAYRSLG
jgi:uncharacterized membrane protein YkvA (DUF1232 family)